MAAETEQGRRSEAGAVVEEFAETDGEKEIAEEGVFKASEEQRLRRMVGESKEGPAENAESDSQPVTENDVDESKGESAGEDDAPAASEQWFVAPKEKSTVEEFLGKDGEDWVKEHDQHPEGRGTLDEREEKFGRKEANGECQAEQTDGVAQQERGEVRGDVGQRE